MLIVGCQFLFLGAIDMPLELKGFHLAVCPTHENQKTVHAGQQGIDGTHHIVFHQGLFISDHRVLCDLAIACKYRKSTDIPEVFLNGIVFVSILFEA